MIHARSPSNQRPRFGPASRIASHAVEIVFVLLVAVAFWYTMRLTRDSFFFADEWRLIAQSQSLTGLFKPYNGHSSFFFLATYRVLFELFGFDYTPFRVVGFVTLYAVPLTYFFTTRRTFGAPLAALLALPLVWYGRYVSLLASNMAFLFALLGAIACAAALNRGRQADWVLATGLVFSLWSANVGVAIAAACLVHNACMRPHLRRWLAVVVPSLAWIAYWLIEQRQVGVEGPYRLSAAQTVRFIRDLSYTPFASAALDVGFLAVLLLGAYVGYVAWSVLKGLRHGANALAWSVSLLVLGYGLATNRGVLADPTEFRYRYIALGFALLAVVPARPIVWPQHFGVATDLRLLVGAAAVLLVVGSALALAVRNDMRTSGAWFGAVGRSTRGNAMLVAAGPSVVADDVELPFALGQLHAGGMRSLFARKGPPDSTTRQTVDRRLVAIRLDAAAHSKPYHAQCRGLTKPVSFQPSLKFVRPAHVGSPNRAFDVEIRRFGDAWVTLARGKPGDAFALTLPALISGRPYQVRAIGACWLAPHR